MFFWQATAPQDRYAVAHPKSNSELCLCPRLRSTHLGSVVISQIENGHFTDQSSTFYRSLCLEVGRNILFSVMYASLTAILATC